MAAKRADKGKTREADRSPSRSPRRDRTRSPSSDDDHQERGRSSRRGRDARREESSRRRPRSPSWTFAQTFSCITHSEWCEKCTRWLAHRATAGMSSSYYWARQDEEDYWEWAIEKSRKKPADSPLRKRRRRSSSRRSPREKGKRSRDSRPMSVDRRQAAEPAESLEEAKETIRLKDLRIKYLEEVEVAKRDQQINYLEDVAEIMRRELGVRARWNTPNTWSNRSLFAEDGVLKKAVEDYERQRLETAEDPWGCPESEEEEDYEIRKKKRRKEMLPKGRWKHRTLTSSSHSIPASDRKGHKTTLPLEERFEDPPAQEGPFQRDQQGGGSSSAADRWHSNIQGRSSRPLIRRMGEAPGTMQAYPPTPQIEPRVPTGPANPIVPGPQFVVTHYLPERDNERRVIPLRENRAGWYRIVYGVVLDLGRPFPPEPPTTFMFNPITGFRWTQAELEAYPRGFPGHPASCPAPVAGQGGRTMPGNKILVQRYVMSVMDKSSTDMQEFRRPEGGWRPPASAAEVQRLQEIALRPTNIEALNFKGRLVNEASRVPAEARNEVQQALTTLPGDRPLWAEYRASKSRGQKVRARMRKAEREMQQQPQLQGQGILQPQPQMQQHNPPTEQPGPQETAVQGGPSMEMGPEIAGGSTHEVDQQGDLTMQEEGEIGEAANEIADEVMGEAGGSTDITAPPPSSWADEEVDFELEDD